MNDARLERKRDIKRKEKKKQKLQREKARMNRRRAELRRKEDAPQDMLERILTRYDLEIMELTEQINLKNEELYKLKNGW